VHNYLAAWWGKLRNELRKRHLLVALNMQIEVMIPAGGLLYPYRTVITTV
jgi:hypothetical protein